MRFSVSDATAGIATGTSIASASLAWLVQASQVASFLASVVAIVAGLFAIAYYVKALRKP